MALATADADARAVSVVGDVALRNNGVAGTETVAQVRGRFARQMGQQSGAAVLR